MADKVIDSSTSVTSVLNESKVKTSSQLLLNYTKDIREFTQEAALEAMVSNEQLGSMTKSIKSLTVTLEKGFSGFSKAFVSTFNSMLPMIREREMEERGYRDVTPQDNKQLALTHSGSMLNAANRKADSEEIEETQFNYIMKGFAEDTRDYVGEIAFYMRTVLRDLEYFKSHSGERNVTPERPDTKKPKKDSSSGGDGLFDWLFDILGISGEIAAAKGFFSKIKGRFKNTLVNIGKHMDTIFGFVSRTFSRVFGGISKIVGTVTKKMGIDKLVNTLIDRAAGVGSRLGKNIGGVFTAVTSKFTKAFPRLSGILTKIGGGIGGFLSKITGFAGGAMSKIGGKALAKMSGMTFAKAVPVIGQVIMAFQAIADASSALQDSVKITGKAKEFQTLGDKVNVGISGIISGFTFGLVSTKTAYKWVTMAETAIGGALKAVFNMFPAPFRKVMTNLWDSLFDEKTGVFGGVISMFEGILDKLGNGQYLSALWDALMFVPKGIFNVLQRTFDKLTDFVSGKGSGLAESLWDMMASMFVAIKDWAVNGIKEFAKNPKQSLLSLWEKMTDVDSSKREAAVETVSQKTQQINDLIRSGDKKGAAAAYADLQSFSAANDMAGDSRFQERTADQMKQVQASIKTGVVQDSSSLNTEQAMEDSKSRLDAQTKKMGDVNVTPIVSMPPQQQEKPKIIRRTEGTMDSGLAFANYAN